MAHTPGPWFANGDCIEADGPEGPRDVTVAGVWRNDDDWERNAHLIAAAPELLAAARLANQELLDLGVGSSGSPALRALWAAIAKAEGRTDEVV
jgi:hypothetical protein